MARTRSNSNSATGDGVSNASTFRSQAPGRQTSTMPEIKPDQDQVRKRAYELYLRRAASGEPGTPASDWLKAERELLAKR